MKDKIRYVYLVLTVIVLVISLVMANSFGFFEYVKKGINPNRIKINFPTRIRTKSATANVVVEIDDNSALNISNGNAFPVSDEVGRSFTPYIFTIKNLGPSANYKLKIINDIDAINEEGCNDNLLNDVSVRYQLIKEGSIVSENLLSNLNNRVIESGVLDDKTDYNYELRLWIDSAAGIEVMNKHFHGKIEVVIG